MNEWSSFELMSSIRDKKSEITVFTVILEIVCNMLHARHLEALAVLENLQHLELPTFVATTVTLKQVLL